MGFWKTYWSVFGVIGGLFLAYYAFALNVHGFYPRVLLGLIFGAVAGSFIIAPAWWYLITKKKADNNESSEEPS